MKERGLIQVYTGKGKGKTTAALGQALRAAGQGFRVRIIQFLKGGSPTGEQKALEGHPLIEMESFGREGFVHRRRPTPEDRMAAREGLARALTVMEQENVDLLILDEVNVAVAYGLLPVEEVLDFLRRRPPSLEVILTGREAHPLLVESADLVTEMKEVKHPLRQGIGARRGIEY